MNQEVIDFSNQVRSLMCQSERVTKSAIESISFLESDIKQHETKMKDVFKIINAKVSRHDNLNVVIKEIDTFLKLIDSIENDKLCITQGPKTTLGDYIKKLEYLKSMEKYIWLKDLSFNKFRSKKFENSVHIYYNMFKTLMSQGESLICYEFQNILKHYSSAEQMESFIEFLINKFEDKNQHINIKQTNDDSASSTTKIELFIPYETISKLEQICWWFLQREQNYELYDEKNKHCDINKKLKYNEIRDSFLETCLTTYFKMSSLGFLKDSNDKFKQSINKIFQTARSQLSVSSSSASLFSSQNNIQSIGTSNSNFNNINTNYKEIKDDLLRPDRVPAKQRHSSTISLNLSNLGNETSSSRLSIKDLSTSTVSLNNTNNISTSNIIISGSQKSQSKPVDYIEIFAQNLDFSLKLLQHENALIQNIYCKSDETRIDLISKLTIFVINQIRAECEIFFTNSLNFTELSNINHNVVRAIIRLIIKVQNLKEKATCLQTEDLESTTKLLKFSLRLNEISSQIFSTYLDVIKTGYLNTYGMPSDFSVHDYCIKICEAWRFICRNEKYILDPIKIVCDSLKQSSASKKNFLKSKSKVDVDEEEEKISNYQRTRRVNRETSESQDEQNEKAQTQDEFEYSEKWYFAKYYSLIIQKLDSFLIEETIKSCESNKVDFLINTLSLGYVSNTFKNHLKTLKAFTFLVNNLVYVLNFLNEMEIITNIKKINPKFENVMQTNIDNNINKAVEIFKYLNNKWIKMNNSNPGLIREESETSEVLEDDAFEDDSIKQRKHSNLSRLETSSLSINRSNRSINESLSLSSSSRNNSIKSYIKMSFTDSKKRKDELFFMLKETLAQSFKIVIENKAINDLFKSKVHDYLYPILNSFEASGDIKLLADDLLKNYKTTDNDKSILKDLIIEKMFPNSRF